MSTTAPLDFFMKVTVSDLDLTELAISEEQSRPRTEGVHVSSVIRHIVKTSGIQKDTGFDADDLDQFAIVGRLWERVLADAKYVAPRYQRPSEIEKDGILGSPDALDFEECAVREMKVTWVSAKKFEERVKFRLYCWQAGAYCEMLGWPRCIFDVLHVRGDYTDGVPIARQYKVLWTPQELKGNWKMLRRNIPSDIPTQQP